jgi:hypothetical protein
MFNINVIFKLENAQRCQNILVTTVNYLSNTAVTDYRLAKNLDYMASLDETQRVTQIRRLLALYEVNNNDCLYYQLIYCVLGWHSSSTC